MIAVFVAAFGNVWNVEQPTRKAAAMMDVIVFFMVLFDLVVVAAQERPALLARDGLVVG